MCLPSLRSIEIYDELAWKLDISLPAGSSFVENYIFFMKSRLNAMGICSLRNQIS